MSAKGRSPSPVDYAVREAQRAGRVEAVGQRHLRAVPRRLAAHLVPQTTASRAVASRGTEAWVWYGPALRGPRFPVQTVTAAVQRTIWRRHSITQTDRLASDALRHTRGCPAAPVQRSRSGFSLCQAHSRYREPSQRGRRAVRPPVFCAGRSRRRRSSSPAFHRQALRIHIRGAIDLFVSDGIRGPKRSTTA